jgi:GrpB-like predicted nucleotidyltransferase (UPF0157 family)
MGLRGYGGADRETGAREAWAIQEAGRMKQPEINPTDIITFEDGDPAENPWVIAGEPRTEEIKIEAYSLEWPKLFGTSKSLIDKALSGVALNIEHIGSTAVPRLSAKPVIDIDLIVNDPDRDEDYVPVLSAIGYVLTVRERSWYRHRMLWHDAPRVNLHVFGPSCPEHIRHVLFRDWLRDHPDDQARYAEVKLKAKIGVDNGQDYNRNKQAVVREIYQRIFEHRGWTTVA